MNAIPKIGAGASLASVASGRPIPVQIVKETVAHRYGVSLPALDSPRRAQAIVRPRHIAIYIAHLVCCQSYAQIGLRFGGRDHTTVLQAIAKMEVRVERDPALAAEIRALIADVERRAGRAPALDRAEALIEDVVDGVRRRLLVQARRKPDALLKALAALADGGQP